MFGLSYDQFLDLVNEEVKAALYRGGSLSDLDTVFRLPEYTKVKADIAGRIISQEVKDLVWNRDGGKCAQCSSNARLEFDHIIPFQKVDQILLEISSCCVKNATGKNVMKFNDAI